MVFGSTLTIAKVTKYILTLTVESLDTEDFSVCLKRQRQSSFLKKIFTDFNYFPINLIPTPKQLTLSLQVQFGNSNKVLSMHKQSAQKYWITWLICLFLCLEKEDGKSTSFVYKNSNSFVPDWLKVFRSGNLFSRSLTSFAEPFIKDFFLCLCERRFVLTLLSLPLLCDLLKYFSAVDESFLLFSKVLCRVVECLSSFWAVLETLAVGCGIFGDLRFDSAELSLI